MTVLEPGPGMGFFTLEIAKLVGSSGRVVAVDVQPQMIEGLKRRARKAGLLDRIDARVVSPASMQVADLNAIADLCLHSLSCMRCRPPRPSSPKLPEP